MLLGSDPSKWSPYEPLPAPPALFNSLPLFESAIRAAAEGDVERARGHLLAVESDAIREWYINHALPAGACRVALLAVPLSTYAGEVDRLKMVSAGAVRELIARDGYRCRYCQRPVVHGELLDHLQAVVGEAAFPIGPRDIDTHGSVIAHRAVLDHVVPRSRGGRTDPGNLVTACHPCNYSKWNYTLEQLGIFTPRPPMRDGWDGLHSLIPALKSQARARS